MYMTHDEINHISRKVADLVISALEEKQKQWDTELIKDLKEVTDNTEEKLLSDLAQAMTALDYNLKLENYPRCAELQATILDLENQ
jgi:Holliday junction resolvasome RuvABC DNA-binding subunit